jgi:hypothetical protein
MADSVRASNNPAIQIGMAPSLSLMGFARNTGQAVANSFAANNASNQIKDLSTQTGIPFGANTADLASGYNSESMNLGTYGLLGNELGAREAMTTPAKAFRDPVAMAIPGANPYEGIDMSREAVEARSDQQWSPEPNLPEGGGGDEPYIPPQPPVRPPREQEPQIQEREPQIGRLRNYNSYARRFFSQV